VRPVELWRTFVLARLFRGGSGFTYFRPRVLPPPPRWTSDRETRGLPPLLTAACFLDQTSGRRT